MKLISGLLKFIIGIILFVVICICGMYIYHKICNKLYEDKYYKVPGDLIEVYDKEFMHAKKFGDGEYTIVMLSGMGTPSPYYDFYNLAESLSEKNTVIIVEQLGYGYSTISDKERTLDNYLYETQKVMDYYEIKDKIILLAHSYMGPITLEYANNNNGVVGYVCLDCSSSYQVEKQVINNEPLPKYEDYYSYMSPSGLTRFIGLIGGQKLLDELYTGDVKQEFKKDYEYLIYNRVLDKTIVNEMRNFPLIAKEMLYKKYRDDLHVITFLASETIESMDEYLKSEDFLYDWKTMHEKLISNEEIQTIKELNGSHYIHHGNVEEITNEINEMINNL